MKLSGEDFKQLLTVILDSYPDIADLERLVRLELEEILDSIAGGSNSNNTQKVFKLIQWFESKDKLNLFIKALSKDRPHQQVFQEILKLSADNYQSISSNSNKLFGILNHKDLEDSYEKLRKKLRILKNKYSIENEVEEKYKIKQLIDEYEQKLEEIEEELECIEKKVKINSYKKGDTRSDIEKIQTHDDLYKALLKLGYWEQQRFFEKIIITKKQSHGAFVIHGKSKQYGQRWLLNRLALVISKSLDGKNIVIDLNRTTSRTDILGIWEELAGWVDLEESSPNAIISEIFKLWQTQNVIICFNNVDGSIEDNLRDLINGLWLHIYEKISDIQSNISPFKLLVFFLDYQGIIINWDLSFVDDYDDNLRTKFPFTLPEVIPFSSEIIRTWLEQQSENLPETISLDKEETIKVILEKQGIPDLTIRKICTLCGCNWFQQEKKWLHL